MGNLTEDMTRLHDEIIALHEVRETFRNGLAEQVGRLKNDVEDMMSGFRAAHTEMAERGASNRYEFVSGLKDGIAEMQAGFHKAREEMAEMTGQERIEFLQKVRNEVDELRDTIAERRAEFAADIAGAHRAWSGPTGAEIRRAAAVEKRAEAKQTKRPVASKPKATKAKSRKKAKR